MPVWHWGYIKDALMKQFPKQLLVASLLACLGMAATAQTATDPTHDRMTQRDPARMQMVQAKRLAELKEKLHISPAQESAWASFTAAMPTHRMERPNRAEFEQLTTPQRIDKMQAMQTERLAATEQRGQAVKAFYATLSAEQQKTFDAAHARMGRHGHHRG